MKPPKRPVRLFHALALGLVLNLFVFIPPSFANCPSSMIAYWQMEEDTAAQGFSGYVDASEYAHTGVCSGSCPSFTLEGMVYSAQVFNGSDTGIAVAADPVFDFGGSDDFSIEFWFKRDPGISAREVIVGRSSATTSMQWWVGIQSSGRAAFWLESTTGVTQLIESRTQKVIANGIWHHVAAVRQGNQNKLYVDGVLEATASRTYSSGFEAAEPLTIGYLDAGSPLYHFDGLIDEIAVYDSALSANEIQLHYFLSRGYCATHDEPVKIMPMGDSITYDNRTGDADPVTGRPTSERTGYRWPLWTWLNNAGYWVDFLGSERAGEAIFSDPDNAGFPGINDTELYVLLQSGYWPSVYNIHDGYPYVSPGEYLKYYPADVILLHIGTNDVRTEITDVANILDQIDAYSRDITVILARIINRVGGSTTTTQFNSNLGNMAQSRILNGDKIIAVNMETGAGLVYQLEPAGDMFDILHPTNAINPNIIDSGYSKMADVWFDTLENFLPQSSPPAIVSAPVLSVNQGQGYAYDVEADGIPLTFSLTDFPPGMTIDPDTGKIQWIATQGGSGYDVTVRASNWLGANSQSFSIRVNAPPLISDIPNQQIATGGSFAVVQLNDSVFDPDNTDAEISWSYGGNSELMVVISPQWTATITVPNAAWIGSEGITFRATDPGGLFDEHTAVFSVIQGNPPKVDEIPDQTIKAGSSFAPVDLGVTDLDNTADQMTWSVYGNSELSVAISGQLATISAPNDGWTGSETITFRATDPAGFFGEAAATFTVKEASDDKNSSGGSGCFISAIAR